METREQDYGACINAVIDAQLFLVSFFKYNFTSQNGENQRFVKDSAEILALVGQVEIVNGVWLKTEQKLKVDVHQKPANYPWCLVFEAAVESQGKKIKYIWFNSSDDYVAVDEDNNLIKIIV